MKRGSTSGWAARTKDLKREEAKVRAEERTKRSPQEQLAVLDERNGKGVGALKERARLTRVIEFAQAEEAAVAAKAEAAAAKEAAKKNKK